MKILLIVGLGNPGTELEKTRHNSGFMFIDRFVESLKKKGNLISKKEEFDSILYEIPTDFGSKKVIFQKPQTFMNKSGSAVSKFLSFYKNTEIEKILAFDDLDIPLGKYKIQDTSFPKAHRGVLSVLSSSGDEFTSIKLGADSREEGDEISGEDYVLKKMTEEELILLYDAIDEAIASIESKYNLYFV